jgi:hypothetical protein
VRWVGWALARFAVGAKTEGESFSLLEPLELFPESGGEAERENLAA